MKKLSLTVLSGVFAACMTFGVMAITNVETANADTASTNATVDLSVTAIKKSTANDKMLLVTAVTNYQYVYEVGYTGLEDVEKISAETDKYYGEINGETKTWTAETIFGEEYAGAGLIVWEIEYDASEEYTYQAYAKYGTLGESGITPVGTVKGTERTTAAVEEFVENEDALAVLKKTSSWGAYYHGQSYLPGYDETSVWTNACKANSNQVGFTWKKAAIEEMIELGVKKISFNVSTDNGQMVVIYLDDESTGWISGNYKNHPTYTYMNYFESGAKVTVDLLKVTGDLQFACTPDVSWNTNVAVQTKVKFTNVEFLEFSAEEKGFKVLKDTANWGKYYHGWAYETGSDETSVWTNACKANSNQVGFTWKKAAIEQMIALGLKTITFNVSTDNGQMVVIYLDDESTGWISGNYKNHPTYTYMNYFESGAKVTVDLLKVTGDLQFACTPDVSWNTNVAAQTKVTFTNVSFEKMTEEEIAQKAAFAVLQDASSWGTQYHGSASNVGSDINSVWMTANKGYGNYSGMTLTKEACEAIIALGFKTVTFNISTSAGAHVDIYASGLAAGDNWISGDVAAIDGSEYYFASGASVTIDLVKFVEKVAADSNCTPKYALKFVVINGTAWANYAPSQTITFSNVSFGK